MTWRTAVLVFALVAWGGAIGIVGMAQHPDTTAFCYASQGCGGVGDEMEQP